MRSRALLAALVGFSILGCDGDDGRDGEQGPPGAPGSIPAPSRVVLKGEPAPGIEAQIVGVSGGSLAGGAFAPGDTLSVRFTLEQSNGDPWDVAEMNTARILMSGPTFSYQRVLPERTDVASAATQNGDGSWTYTFADPIPSTFLAPLNDSPDLGPEVGELTGEPLLDGTYTVGMYFGWNYTVNGESFRDAGDATFDFLLGSTAVLESRAVVTTENCNQCHDSLQFHGGLRRATTLCLLCHTAGAEDRIATVGGGTPGASIDFRVMIHRIHNGSHLPSVNGVIADVNGDLDYTATPVPYQLTGFGNQLHDYSEIVFPAWPNSTEPMPRDAGFSALGSGEQAQENAIRGGVTSCYLCHGDPDGDDPMTGGPLVAPAQGNLIYNQPSRVACGSCHDDWVWERPYHANGETMPPQLNDQDCRICHGETGSVLAVRDAHLHPLRDPSFAMGVNIGMVSVNEAGTNDGDGRIDAGEKLTLTFTLRDDSGADIDPSEMAQVNAALAGPTWNMQVLESTGIPLALLAGPQPYTIPLPTRRQLEFVGVDNGALQTFTTSLAPHLAVTGAATEVRVVDSLGGAVSALAEAVDGSTNFVDVVNAGAFARDMYVVIDDGSLDVEYLRIQWVDDNRLWFSSPQSTAYATGPVNAHPAGTQVREVLVSTRAAGTDYTLNAATGEITEVLNFGNGGAVLVSYFSEFVMPDTYPVTLNGEPALDETVGNWTGKGLVDGTYRLTLWGRRDLDFVTQGETNSYRERVTGRTIEFLVGDATTVEPYELITSPENCNACHVEISFHGRGRMGFDTCIACHGGAGLGDRPQYVAANAPATTGLNIGFREMLHKIHMGADLANAEDYQIVGFGSGAYPNNFGVVSFEHIHFPAFPAGVKACATCHGDESDAWLEPTSLAHPSEQVTPAQSWRLVCGSCHDEAGAQAHIDAQTAPGGAESCAICHGPGQEWAVEPMHMRR